MNSKIFLKSQYEMQGWNDTVALASCVRGGALQDGVAPSHQQMTLPLGFLLM